MDPELLELITSGGDYAATLAATPEADLPALRQQAEAEARRIGEGLATSTTPGPDADQVERLVGFMHAIDNRMSANSADRQRGTAALESITPPDPEPDPLPEPTPEPQPTPAPEPNPNPEAVTASARRLVRPALPDPVRTRQDTGLALVAAAGIEGVRGGDPFTDRLTMARSMTAALERLGAPGAGQAAKATVASIQTYNREVVLGEDAVANQIALEGLYDRVRKGQQAEAITAASGPFCAPAEPVYDFFELPIGGLVNWPTVDAPRGRRTYPVSPQLEDVTGDWFDMLGSQTSPKPCFVVECGETVTASVTSYPLCLTFDNFTGRFYPELVDNRTSLSVSRFAFVVQAALLAQLEVAANGIEVGNAGGGFIIALLRALTAGAARYRSRHFMPPSARLTVLLPAWVPDAIATDVISRNGTNDFVVSQALVEDILSARGLDVQWVNGWQPIGATGWEAENLDAILYAPGSVVRLSGGELNLGVQRDSVLIGLNQYQIFQETWETLHTLVPPVVLRNIVVCADGTTGEQADITCETLTSGS